MHYIIEFEDTPRKDTDGTEFYKCVDVPWWSSTLTGINRLTPATLKFTEMRNDGRREGRKEAWNAARKIFKMSNEQRCRLLDVETETLAESMDWMTVEDAFRVLDGLKINVGDEVLEDNGKKAVVTRFYEDTDEGVDLIYSTGETGYTSNVLRLVKTGRHFDIEGILKQIAEG